MYQTKCCRCWRSNHETWMRINVTLNVASGFGSLKQNVFKLPKLLQLLELHLQDRRDLDNWGPSQPRPVIPAAKNITLKKKKKKITWGKVKVKVKKSTQHVVIIWPSCRMWLGYFGHCSTKTFRCKKEKSEYTCWWLSELLLSSGQFIQQERWAYPNSLCVSGTRPCVAQTN